MKNEKLEKLKIISAQIQTDNQLLTEVLEQEDIDWQEMTLEMARLDDKMKAWSKLANDIIDELNGEAERASENLREAMMAI